tara:strand:- start:1002 stop:1682 length:681 start_codon:yes stop_codon:yes gene_type:complete
MQEISLLILCAGFGKRMLDLTTTTPKPLLKIKNKILLGNTINFFKDIGCNEIFINTHYLHKNIEEYIIRNFSTENISTIYEPSILGTGGGVKNIFNYTKNNKICVVNSDIFWIPENKKDIKNFLKNSNDVSYCKILLSKNDTFYGLKKKYGDFNIKNGTVSKWNKGNDILIYSGIQIVSKNIFKQTKKKFSMNNIWDHLITDKKLNGDFMSTKILHIGDKNSFHQF